MQLIVVDCYYISNISNNIRQSGIVDKRKKNAKNPFIFKLFSNVEKRIKFVEERWKKNVDKWKKNKIVGKWTGQI